MPLRIKNWLIKANRIETELICRRTPTNQISQIRTDRSNVFRIHIIDLELFGQSSRNEIVKNCLHILWEKNIPLQQLRKYLTATAPAYWIDAHWLGTPNLLTFIGSYVFPVINADAAYMPLPSYDCICKVHRMSRPFNAALWLYIGLIKHLLNRKCSLYIEFNNCAD